MRARAAKVSSAQNRRPRPAQKARALTGLVPITEDAADGIISTERLKKERRYSLDRVLRENSIEPGMLARIDAARANPSPGIPHEDITREFGQ